MASISIEVKNNAISSALNGAIERACLVSDDMILVSTSMRDGQILKTIRTKCPLAIAIIESAQSECFSHE